MCVYMCMCAHVHMSVCTCAYDLLGSAQKLEDRHAMLCVCMCVHMNVGRETQTSITNTGYILYIIQ